MVRLTEISFACEDPKRLAAFWAAALDYEVVDIPPKLQADMAEAGLDPDGIAAAAGKEQKGPKLFFERKPKRPPVENTSIPIHLDIESPDRRAHVARLVALGGTVIEEKELQVGDRLFEWTVMQDPEGNGFCVEQLA